MNLKVKISYRTVIVPSPRVLHGKNQTDVLFGMQNNFAQNDANKT